MGLAPYGKPTYVEQLRQVIRPVDGGRFELNLDYFRHHTEGVEMTWDDGSPHLGLVFSPKLVRVARSRARPRGPGFLRKVGRHRAQRAGGLRGDLLPRSPGSASTHRPRAPLARGRVRPQLRGEREDLRADGLPRIVRATRGRRRRHGHWCCLLRRACRSGPTAPVRDAGRLHGTGFRRTARWSDAIERARGNGWDATISVRRLEDAGLFREVAGGRGSWQGGRLVPGPHGVRAACARQPIDRGRPPARRHEGHPQPADQAPRDIPSLRARASSKRRQPTYSSAVSPRPSC